MNGLPLVDEWAYYVSDAAFRGVLRGSSRYVMQAPAMTHMLHQLPALLAPVDGGGAGTGSCSASGSTADGTNDCASSLADVLVVFMVRDCDASIRSQARIGWTDREEWREVVKYSSSPELLPYVRSRAGSTGESAGESRGESTGESAGGTKMHDPICRVKQNAWGRFQRKQVGPAPNMHCCTILGL
jgi:hypothetical protein